MDKFEKKSMRELKRMPVDELSAYYRALRKYNYENNIPVKGLKRRKVTKKVLRLIIKYGLNRLSHRKVKVINDESTKTENPRIYAYTHFCRYDIETMAEVIKESAYFLWGDPGKLYVQPAGKIVKELGAVFVDTDDKMDRHIGEKTAIEILKRKGNIIITPEGAWLMSPYKIVGKLYSGAIRMALEANADIIPVAIDKKGNNYYVNIGKNIKATEWDKDNLRSGAEKLREKMATLKWNIWEHLENDEKYWVRKQLPDNYLAIQEMYENEIMSELEEDDNYSLEAIEQTRYKDKNETEREDAFSFMPNLKINEKNAFLFKNMSAVDRQVQAKVLKRTK